MKHSLRKIGKVVDTFNDRLIDCLKSKGISIYVDKIDVYGRDKDIVSVRYASDEYKTHAFINISELMAINFNIFDYRLEITDISDEIDETDVEGYTTECNSDDLFRFNCTHDIIIINSGGPYLETYNTIHKPVRPHIKASSPEINEDAIFKAIKNGKIYGIDVILYKKYFCSIGCDYDNIGMIINDFNNKLLSTVRGLGISIRVDKVIYDWHDQISIRYFNTDKEIYTTIDITGVILWSIKNNALNYYFEIYDMTGRTYSAEKTLYKPNLIYTINGRRDIDILIINDKYGPNTESFGYHPYCIRNPYIMVTGKKTDQDIILEKINNSKIYGIKINFD